MRNRHINAARNVWDRAVTLMPRIEQFWFKYVYMEEMVGNLQGSRVNNAARGDGMAVIETWIFSLERFGGSARSSTGDARQTG